MGYISSMTWISRSPQADLSELPCIMTSKIRILRVFGWNPSKRIPIIKLIGIATASLTRLFLRRMKCYSWPLVEPDQPCAEAQLHLPTRRQRPIGNGGAINAVV